MARDFNINGETMVTVKGNGALMDPNSSISQPKPKLWQLGLAEKGIKIQPRWKHRDVLNNDFGDIPIEVQWMLADVIITMTLIHYDSFVLDACVTEAMGGGTASPMIANPSWGTYGPAGLPMGGNAPLFAQGNHYISLNLASPVLNKPFHFYATYLAEEPVEYNIGTETSVVPLKWRCIPYKTAGTLNASFTSTDNNPDDDDSPPFPGGEAFEAISAGTILFDHNVDTN